MAKILIIAHECSPQLGSECFSGWNIVTRLAKKHDVIVIHADQNQLGSENYTDQINQYLNSHDSLNCKFVAVHYPLITKYLLKIGALFSRKSSVIGNQFIYFINYNLWHRQVKKHIETNIDLDEISLVHLLNHISYREPGYLYGTSKPFVWGPISGLAKVKPSYLKNYPVKHRVLSKIRDASAVLMLVFNRRILTAASKTDWLFCVTTEDQNRLGQFAKNSSVLLDVGSTLVPKVKREDFDRRPIRLLWVGRVDFNKGLDIFLYALTKIPFWHSKLQVTILGDGPQLDYFKSLASNLMLHKIQWMGSVRHSEVGSYMDANDLLIHTSIKEAGCAVVLEALSHGLPVIAHDAFGMAQEIDITCGRKLSYLTPEKSSHELSNYLEFFISKPSELTNLSEGAYIRARLLSWDSLVDDIDAVYSKII